MKKLTLSVLSVGSLILATAGSVLASPPAPIPEPGTFALVGIGIAGFFLYKKNKK